MSTEALKTSEAVNPYEHYSWVEDPELLTRHFIQTLESTRRSLNPSGTSEDSTLILFCMSTRVELVTYKHYESNYSSQRLNLSDGFFDLDEKRQSLILAYSLYKCGSAKPQIFFNFYQGVTEEARNLLKVQIHNFMEGGTSNPFSETLNEIRREMLTEKHN